MVKISQIKDERFRTTETSGKETDMADEKKNPEEMAPQEGGMPPFPGFDPDKMPDFMKDFDPSKMPPFDPDKMPDFMKNFDPSKMPPFDPSKMPGFGGDDGADDEEMEDYLQQEDPRKWLRQPPHKMRGDMRKAMKAGRAADKMECNCWNKHCPFHGNCKSCIVFHKVLRQLPTCLRDMVIGLYKEGVLSYELYITDQPVDPIP